jgi:hypothetical protein
MTGGYIVTRQVVDVAFMGPLFPGRHSRKPELATSGNRSD